MAGLQLGFDEEILAECSGVRWISKFGNIDQHLDTLVLTNDRVCGTYKKGNGLFKKSSEEIIELRLDSIKVKNGQPMVVKKWDFNTLSWLLELQTTQGTHIFVFQESSKKNAALWETEIYKVFGLLSPSDPTAEVRSSGFSGITESLKDVAGSVLGKMSFNQTNFNNYQRTSISSRNEHTTQQSSGIPPIGGAQSTKVVFCSNCGAKLNGGAKFCHNCGAEVVWQSQPTPPTATTRTDTGTYTSRVQEFAGKIIKCPNCGQTISNTEVVCPSCGHQITDRTASSSVQRLVSELMVIENSRRQKNALDNLVQSFTGTDGEESSISNKKITLIKNFPIPNTIGEISEFVILAAGNIDVNLSKVSLGNKLGRSGNDSKANERGISDAWVGKLQQAYQKAELMFSDMPIFNKVQEVYTNKMRELNMLK